MLQQSVGEQIPSPTHPEVRVRASTWMRVSFYDRATLRPLLARTRFVASGSVRLRRWQPPPMREPERILSGRGGGLRASARRARAKIPNAAFAERIGVDNTATRGPGQLADTRPRAGQWRCSKRDWLFEVGGPPHGPVSRSDGLADNSTRVARRRLGARHATAGVIRIQQKNRTHRPLFFRLDGNLSPAAHS